MRIDQIYNNGLVVSEKHIDEASLEIAFYELGQLVERRAMTDDEVALYVPPPTSEELLQAQIDALLTLLAQGEQP
jgi:hypothetical protein